MGLLAAVGVYLAPSSTALQVGGPSRGAGGPQNPGSVRVLDPGKPAFGKTYGEWASAWWEWAFSFHADMNPVFDDTGQFCDLGQSGPVWFLAGNFGVGTFVRTCTVPHGKALFFPLYNGVSFAPEFGTTVEEIRADVNEDIEVDALGLTLACTINGEPIGDLFAYRAQSPPGGFVLESDALLMDSGFDPGPRDPAVADGYWLMVKGLPPGENTLNIQAAFGAFFLDVTYFLTMQPGGGPGGR